MAKEEYYNSSFYNFSDDTLTSQDILDVFIIQEILDLEDAEKIRKRYKTNREIENYLVSTKIVSRDTINKAYSILLRLPYIELKHMEIPPELLKMVPLKTIKRFGIVPFAVSDGTVKVALSRPSEILVNYKLGLAKLFQDKGLSIELYITGETDFLAVLKQYRGDKSALLLKKGSLPVVYLRNQAISESYLKKLPGDFIKKHRIVVFGQNQNGSYLLASEEPDSPTTLKIVNFISKENNVKVELFATSKADVDYALSLLSQIKTEEGIEEDFLNETEEKQEKTIEEQAPLALNSERQSLMGNSGQEVLAKGLGIEDNEKTSSKERIDKEDMEEKNKDDELTIDIVEKIPQEPKKANDEHPKTSIFSKTKERDDSLENVDLGSLVKNDILDEKKLLEIAKENYIPKTVAAVINYALNKGASDIHIEPEAKSLRVRCRIDGILKDVLKLSPEVQPPFISRIKIMSKLKIDEMRIPQDGRFDIAFKDREVDVRVSTLPTVHGEKIVMRILDKSQAILSLEDIGMQGSAFDETVKAIGDPYGIILVTGPTGSGKSTTLYAVLNRISVPGVNIVTLEDPVEYEIVGINQCQIKPDIGFTFAAGLRSILRQDPNIIMVGEIRDAETAGMATHAALTGHLVLSTLHTNDTAGALPRLINMGVEPFLITSSVNLVIAQRLVRRICPKCKEEMKVPPKLMEQLKTELSSIPINNLKDKDRIPKELKLYYGRGCSECSGGYKGRIGIYEVMTINPEIENLAVAKRSANEIKEASIKSGMLTMKQDGILKAFAGITTIDEVFQAVVSG